MPQKYDKHMRARPGFKPRVDQLRQIAEISAERKQKRIDKARYRKFLAEPEELKVLDAIAHLPPEHRANAAEAALIARVARRKKLISCK